MKFSHQYFENVHKLIEEIEKNELEKIQIAALAMAQSIQNGGIIHWFGSGHSSIPTLEVYIRAGTFTNSRPVSLEHVLDRFERIEGIGQALMRGFDGKPNEVIFIFSNSGVNPLPMEVAQISKDKGLFTVGVVSFNHSLKTKPKLKNNLRLMDIVDVAIDTHTPYGDACLEAPGLQAKFGPLSTIANVTIVHAAIAETVEILLNKDFIPPIRISRNTPEGDAHNSTITPKYIDRIPELGQ